MAAPEFLIVGLGNPGEKYQRTRHNIGFMAIAHLTEASAASATKPPTPCKTLLWQSRLANTPVLLLQPQTFMNLSGQAVQPLLAYYKLAPEQLIVIYDEVALPLGKLRVRLGGSAGGHNGIKSLIQHCGERFVRVRVGVGPEPKPQPDAAAAGDPAASKPYDDLADYVLGNFNAAETKRLPGLLTGAAQAVEAVMTLGVNDAMNRVNGQSF
ncbi:MAG: aminoacyl-tRNA hydrolase [Vampirovibrionales bacterium]|nr:aminoacyl-tRNA hydrolase [Vampirovibrionales bacterium]